MHNSGIEHKQEFGGVAEVSLLQIYFRALGYLAADKKRVALICGANVALAAIAILEPILLGRVIGAISEKGPVF
ncbi:MAG: glucan ABC transporter ATP-binding protein/ permease, partial [Mesorhizobium sp.]